MKIILRQDVEKIGKLGETINAKDGYARNYLIPRGLALEATDKSLKIIEKEKQNLIKKIDREKKEIESLAQKIKNTSCTISVEVGLDDKLFGVVTNQDIAKAYEQEGVVIDKRLIDLKDPIRELGVFYVPIKLHPEVTVEAKVWIVKT
ncbi:MAG: 50S ribosomal protein L9 [Candidatus Omnitrophica bacterium]|nr:50S ribosomal protein L9 [Candidatus Omnitrophota bacterium]